MSETGEPTRAPKRTRIERTAENDPGKSKFIDELIQKHRLFGGNVHARTEEQLAEAECQFVPGEPIDPVNFPNVDRKRYRI